MNKIKKIFLPALLFLITVVFTGCYTVVWTPEMQLPSRDRNNSGNDGYYNDYYYGDYYNYYDAPWWYNITPPSYTNQPEYYRDTSAAMQSLRNDYGGRGNTGGRLEIPQATPSTRSDNSSGSNQGSSAVKRTEDSGSRNSSSNNNNSNGNRSSSNNRNSNNDRNSNGRN